MSRCRVDRPNQSKPERSTFNQIDGHYTFNPIEGQYTYIRVIHFVAQILVNVTLFFAKDRDVCVCVFADGMANAI